MNRLETESWFADAQDVTADREIEFGYDLLGRLMGTSDPDHLYSYEYGRRDLDLPPTVTPLAITGLGLVEDTDGTSDTDSDGITSNPTVKGIVGSNGTGAFAVVELTVTIEQEPATTHRVNADAAGYFEFAPSGLANGDDVSVTAKSIVYDPVNNVEVPGTATSPFSYEHIDNELATFTSFALLNPPILPATTITDPTLIGNVVNNDGRVSGLRIEFDHDENGSAEGYAFTDEIGNFEYTPYGLASGEHTIVARVYEWDFASQEYVETDSEDVDFELSQAGPTEPEFDPQFAANLDVIDVADAGFKDAVFSVLDYLNFGSASGALDLGFGSIQLLHRGGVNAARNPEVPSDQFFFTPNSGEYILRNAASTVAISTANGGSVTADYSIVSTIEFEGPLDANISIEFDVLIDAPETPYALVVSTASAGEELSSSLSLLGHYHFTFNAAVYLNDYEVLGGSHLISESLTYDYQHIRSVNSSGTGGGASNRQSTQTTAGDHESLYEEGSEGQGEFGSGSVYTTFEHSETRRQETWTDESGTESFDDGVRSSTRSYSKQEHSLYVETVGNSGTINIGSGVQTISGNLSIDATGDLTADEWETVLYANQYTEENHESGTRTTQTQALYHGNLDADIDYSIDASQTTSDNNFTFHDDLQTNFWEEGNGNSSIGGTSESWHYAVQGWLDASLDLDGTSSFSRDSAGTVHRNADVYSNLFTQAEIVGVGGGSATYSVGTQEDDYQDSGTAQSVFSFYSDGEYQEAAHAVRIDDEFTIDGAARLLFGGSVRQTGVVKGHTTIDEEDFESDVDYQVFTSGKAAITGGANFTFTVTDSGSSAAGSYAGSQSLAGSRASQAVGTVTVDGQKNPIRDNSAGTFTRDVTDRGTFSNCVGWAIQPDESSRRGHAKIVEVTTDKSTSFAGLAGLLEEWPPEWDEEPIQIYLGGGSASLTKATYKRTVTEEFDYEEKDGQFAREGTITDVTERTAESLAAMQGADEDRATFASRNDNGHGTSDRFVGTFVEDASGFYMTGVSTGNQTRNNANSDAYTSSKDDEGDQGQSTSSNQSKSRSEGTLRGGIIIGPDGVVTGPVSFTGNDLSRVQNRGSSFRIRATNEPNGDEDVKRVTAEGGSGRTRGQAEGESNGTNQGTGGPDWNAQTQLHVVTDGDTNDTLFFHETIVKTNSELDTKITEELIWHGNDYGKQDGTANGTVASGRDEGTELSVDTKSEGNNGFTTTRIVTIKTPEENSYLSVTRVDEGEGHANANGTVKRETGSTQFEGSADGKIEADATVTYNHRRNGKPVGGRTSYAFGNGTLTNNTVTTFESSPFVENENEDEPTHLVTTVARTEDTTEVEGWSEGSVWNVLTGSGTWKGERTTRTVDGGSKTHVLVDLENGEVAVVSDPAGNSGGTNKINLVNWDYAFEDFDNYTTFNRNWTSMLTDNSTAELTASDQTVVLIENTKTSTKPGQDPATVVEKVVTSTSTQTATSEGDEKGDEQTLKTTLDFDSTETTTGPFEMNINDLVAFQEEGVFEYVIPEEPRTVKITHDQTYVSSHKIGDEPGLAVDGRFTLYDKQEQTDTRKAFKDQSGSDWTGSTTAIRTLILTTTTNERGSYYDVKDGSLVSRQMTGSATIVTASQDKGTLQRVHDGVTFEPTFPGQNLSGPTDYLYNGRQNERKTRITQLDYDPQGETRTEKLQHSRTRYAKEEWEQDRLDPAKTQRRNHLMFEVIGPDPFGNMWSLRTDVFWGSHSGAGSMETPPLGQTISNDSYNSGPIFTNPLTETVTLRQPKPYKAPPVPPDGIVAAFFSGLGTGAKAQLNAGSDTIFSFVTIGGLLADPSSNQFRFDVTREDIDNGYGLSYGAGRLLQEFVFAVGTGGAASALSKGGGVARAGGYAIGGLDVAGNAYNAGSGVVDAAQNGFNAQNSIQIAGGAFGLAGNYAAGRRALDQLGKDLGSVRKFLSETFHPKPKAGTAILDEIASVGPPRSAQTVALLETAEGKIIVAGGETDLTAAQKALARKRGLLVADDISDKHAEITAIASAGKKGLTPIGGFVNNKMCARCIDEIQELLNGTGIRLRISDDGKSFVFEPKA